MAVLRIFFWLLKISLRCLSFAPPWLRCMRRLAEWQSFLNEAISSLYQYTDFRLLKYLVLHIVASHVATSSFFAADTKLIVWCLRRTPDVLKNFSIELFMSPTAFLRNVYTVGFYFSVVQNFGNIGYVSKAYSSGYFCITLPRVLRFRNVYRGRTCQSDR